MGNQKFDFHTACKLANLRVTNEANQFTVRKVFSLFTKTGVGLILIGVLGGGFAFLALTKSNDTLSLIFGTLFGLGMAAVAGVTIFPQMINNFTISQNQLVSRNGLKSVSFPLIVSHKVRMKTRIEHIASKSLAGSDSYFRMLDIYVSNGSEEYLY